MARSYTYEEIEAMRSSIRTIEFQNGSYCSDEVERRSYIEDQLRTAIMASIDPTELQGKADKAIKAREEWHENWIRIKAEHEANLAKKSTSSEKPEPAEQSQINEQPTADCQPKPIQRLHRPSIYDTRHNSPPIIGTLC